jgi:hypothetical protein
VTVNVRVTDGNLSTLAVTLDGVTELPTVYALQDDVVETVVLQTIVSATANQVIQLRNTGIVDAVISRGSINILKLD